MQGTILKVILPRGFGFVQGEDGVEYFLHASQLPETDWDGDHLHKGVRLEFTPKKTAKGWSACEARIC